MRKRKKMSNEPYSKKPSSVSESSQWHEMSFQISVDHPVDWDEFDLRKWAHTVAAYTARLMCQDLPDDSKIETLLMGVSVHKISFVTDGTLHQIIDEFGEEDE
jgi:hypothetical protein